MIKREKLTTLNCDLWRDSSKKWAALFLLGCVLKSLQPFFVGEFRGIVLESLDLPAAALCALFLLSKFGKRTICRGDYAKIFKNLGT